MGDGAGVLRAHGEWAGVHCTWLLGDNEGRWLHRPSRVPDNVLVPLAREDRLPLVVSVAARVPRPRLLFPLCNVCAQAAADGAAESHGGDDGDDDAGSVNSVGTPGADLDNCALPPHVSKAVLAENARLACDRALFDVYNSQLVMDVASYATVLLDATLRVDGTGTAITPFDQNVRAERLVSDGSGDGGAAQSGDGDDDFDNDFVSDDHCVALASVAFKVAVTHLLNVDVVNGEYNRLQEWLTVLSRTMNVNRSVCGWLIEHVVARPDTLQRCLLECRDDVTRETVSLLLQHAVCQQYHYEGAALLQPDREVVIAADGGAGAGTASSSSSSSTTTTTVGGSGAAALSTTTVRRPVALIACLSSALLTLLPTIHDQWRRYHTLLQVLATVAQLGPEACAWLLSHRALLRVIDLFLGDESPVAPRGVQRSPIDDTKVQPQWAPLLHLMALLVCRSTTHGPC